MKKIASQQWKTLSLSVVDKILTISMNRPKANAMSPTLLDELIQAFDTASKETSIKGVLLRSSLSSIFSSGADLETMHKLSKTSSQSEIHHFIFDKLSRGLTAPFQCSKPVACSLDGHTIAGGLMIALACDYISIGTRKPFKIGITGPIVGIPYPLKALKLAQHQLQPQLAYRLLIDAQLFSSTEFQIRCERGEQPDELAYKWLKMITDRPLNGFQITKKKWWSDLIALDEMDDEIEREDYYRAVTSKACLQAMEKALNKDKQ